MFHVENIITHGGITMCRENKTYSMSIRVFEDELSRLKQAAQIEEYSSYSEFVRRTALLEASRVISREENGRNEHKG